MEDKGRERKGRERGVLRQGGCDYLYPHPQSGGWRLDQYW